MRLKSPSLIQAAETFCQSRTQGGSRHLESASRRDGSNLATGLLGCHAGTSRPAPGWLCWGSGWDLRARGPGGAWTKGLASVSPVPEARLRQTQATSGPVSASHLGPASVSGCGTSPRSAGVAGAAGSPLCGCGFQPGRGTCRAQGKQWCEAGGDTMAPRVRASSTRLSGAATQLPPALPREGDMESNLLRGRSCPHRRLGKQPRFSIFSIWFWKKKKKNAIYFSTA